MCLSLVCRVSDSQDVTHWRWRWRRRAELRWTRLSVDERQTTWSLSCKKSLDLCGKLLILLYLQSANIVLVHQLVQSQPREAGAGLGVRCTPKVRRAVCCSLGPLQ
ncbi:hypothetical protein P153DRAFT_40624 [Dothidotthia symphoricarpi CBS 119687]|uniref:Uncharacterized protein n=1 Tax=Dothidotthia symphoricarpi CBS 119687 TaxID=1392245 RepID=A0A6A6A9E4_9PLEO|nr:uncharacterized protein P153DRAFT_40624 [Dothidotthia symphoricarpi CBS 119687]KAF2128582.1 hypothetical protein P153DRAFT_40624 [Dothidotthia symphoricarpi CBS 119687]